VNLQTYREARQKVRYVLMATNFRLAANDAMGQEPT
jgi:hypothetical protein